MMRGSSSYLQTNWAGIFRYWLSIYSIIANTKIQYFVFIYKKICLLEMRCSQNVYNVRNYCGKHTFTAQRKEPQYALRTVHIHSQVQRRLRPRLAARQFRKQFLSISATHKIYRQIREIFTSKCLRRSKVCIPQCKSRHATQFILQTYKLSLCTPCICLSVFRFQSLE